MVAEYQMVERSLREVMSIYSHATREGQTREMPGVSLVSSGLSLAVFNAAMLSTPVPGPEGDLARRIAVARVYFQHLRLPWSLWLCQDMLTPAARQSLEEMWQKGEFRLTAEPSGMVANSLRPSRRKLPSLDCRLVSDEATRLAFAQVTSVVFDLPYATSRQIYGSDQVWSGRFHGFVGYLQGKPVSTVGLWFADDSIGVYSVGTLPQHQRRGYAEALLRHALAWGHQQTGITQTVLQSTRQGLSLYERIGYRSVTQFAVYVATS